MIQKILDEALAGDNVGLLNRGIQKINIQRDGFDSQKENLIFKKCNKHIKCSKEKVEDVYVVE
ncbi:hypothetical protein QJS10_CPA07g00663 [Acorus calamus]|uniref:Uncharacterized protein n=1 Tax=Acorus calamus TaxID=4465 RepID=A0AAV9EFF8_ACOCL|nr:hypothetical protein QJS10_CPA07g00663 [Acorus calamus]